MRDKDHRLEDTRGYGVSPKGVGGTKPTKITDVRTQGLRS